MQDVFVALIERLPGFTYEPGRRFRGWLWTLMLNRFRARRRAAAVRGAAEGHAAVCDEGSDTVAEFAEAEYRSYLHGRALQLMRADFEPATCRAFHEHVLNHRPVAEVAAELGLTIGAVYAAKARILGRLREELRGLVD